uniref:hypothetical protein n=1 Tax=Cephaleuros parasiticus TaxID=173370 RepID=UPI001EE00F2C|nr:hypothetical protein MFQ79_pgp100 [Cephaleuros parasiticus]UIB38962.1 hypothetical protein [Cephaleuros parasiticus]
MFFLWRFFLREGEKKKPPKEKHGKKKIRYFGASFPVLLSFFIIIFFLIPLPFSLPKAKKPPKEELLPVGELPGKFFFREKHFSDWAATFKLLHNLKIIRYSAQFFPPKKKKKMKGKGLHPFPSFFFFFLGGNF